MLCPGASKSSTRSPFKFAALLALVGAFENEETFSLYVPLLCRKKSVEPTAIAVDIQAGNEITLVFESLPLAIIVATLTLRSWSIASLSGSSSQKLADEPPPRLILTATNSFHAGVLRFT